MELGQKLRKIRNEQGLSIREVANTINVNRGYLSKVERGEVKSISVDKLKDFADFYNVSIQDLLDRNDNWKEKVPEKTKKFVKPENIDYLNIGLLAKKEGLTPEEAKKTIKLLGNIKTNTSDEYSSAIEKAKQNNLSEENLIKIIDAFTNI